MSDHSQIIVDIEASAQEAVPLADSIQRWLVSEGIIEDEPSDSVLGGRGYRPAPGCRAVVSQHDDAWQRLVMNGLAIRAGRQVFETSGNGIELECARCGAKFSSSHSYRWRTGSPGSRLRQFVAGWSSAGSDMMRCMRSRLRLGLTIGCSVLFAGCFASGEHRMLGDSAARKLLANQAASIALQPGLAFSFGDIVAMAGDYFASIEQMLAADPQELRYVRQDCINDHRERFPEAVTRAADRRYYLLASQNRMHFLNPDENDAALPPKARNRQHDAANLALNAGTAYVDGHTRAIELAYRAGAKGETLENALAVEAFADHFLTDAFAGGHLRTPRASIQAYWNTREPQFFERFKYEMADRIADQVQNHRKEIGAPWYTVFASRDMIRKRALSTIERVLTTAGIPPLGFGDVVSLAMHDLDNHAGVAARVRDHEVVLLGDGELVTCGSAQRGPRTCHESAAGAATTQAAVAAVTESIAQVIAAADAGSKGMAPGEFLKSVTSEDGSWSTESTLPVVVAVEKQPKQPLHWKAADAASLLADSAVREALAVVGRTKADELHNLVAQMQPGWERNAFERGVVQTLQEDPMGMLANVVRAAPVGSPAIAAR